MSRSFSANFAGVCAHCDGQIVAGQRIQFIDDDLVHVKCPPPPATCPQCFLTLPASGICGVCE